MLRVFKKTLGSRASAQGKKIPLEDIPLFKAGIRISLEKAPWMVHRFSGSPEPMCAVAGRALAEGRQAEAGGRMLRGPDAGSHGRCRDLGMLWAGALAVPPLHPPSRERPGNETESPRPETEAPSWCSAPPADSERLSGKQPKMSGQHRSSGCRHGRQTLSSRLPEVSGGPHPPAEHAWETLVTSAGGRRP